MTLDKWMRDRKLSNSEMARLCDRSASTISRVRRGVEKARPSLASVIHRVTEGQVTPNDLYLEKTPAKRKRAA